MTDLTNYRPTEPPAPGGFDYPTKIRLFINAQGTRVDPFGATGYIQNLSIAASVAANALTVSLKARDGSDSSSDTPISVALRAATAAGGDFNMRLGTGALALVVSSGSTLGMSNADASWIYVYAIQNGTTVEPAVSRKFFGLQGIVTTTAEGGAGAADSGTVMYSATLRNNVPFRCVGRVSASQATAGTWASAPTAIELWPFSGTDVVVAAGTAAAPSVQVGDERNGLFSPAANTLAVAVGGVEVLRVNSAGALFAGDTSNAKNTAGVTVNQGAFDDELVSLKSSDIAHGITDETETDTLGYLKKDSAAAGGLEVAGFSEGTRGLLLNARHTTDDTTKSTVGNAAVVVSGALKSGTGLADLGANANIFAVRNRTTTRFILDGDGDSHQDVGTAWTNFDHLDDISALNAIAYHVAHPADAIKSKLAEWMVEKRDYLEKHRLVTFNADGHHFVNMSRLTMLLVGAARQQAEKIEAMAALLSEMKTQIEHINAMLPGAQPN